MKEKIDPVCGLTKQEKESHDYLMESMKAWYKLEIQHPEELKAFGDAVHIIQDLLGMRIVRRTFPKYWKNYHIKKQGVKKQ